MRSFLAVLRLELGRWSNVLVVAALGGFVPLLVYVAPGIPDHLRGEICDGATVLGAVALALVTVLNAGFGRLGDPEQRAFLLRRGVPGWAAWSAPALAVWIAAAGALALALVPATLFGRGLVAVVLGDMLLWIGEEGLGDLLRQLAHITYQDRSSLMPDLSATAWQGWRSVWPLLLAGAGLGLVQQLATFLGVAFRDRSWRLLPDLAALPVVLLAFAWATTGLLAHWAVQEWLLAVGILGAFALVGGGVGSALSFRWGRCDPSRAHTGWSLGLWATLLLGVGAVELRATWALHPSLADLGRIEHLEPAPAGSWATITAPIHGRLDLETTVLADLDSGRTVLLPRTTTDTVFSPDGQQAGWVVMRVGTNKGDLYTLDLGDPRAAPRHTELVLDHPSFYGGPWIEALAADGRMVALEGDGTLTVVAIPDGRVLATLAAPNPKDTSTIRARFLEDGRLRAVRVHTRLDGTRRLDTAIEIVELDPGDGSHRSLGRHPLEQDLLGWTLRQDPGGRRLLGLERDPRHLLLLDGETAAPLDEVDLGGLAPREILVLTDGGFLVAAGQEPTSEGYAGDAVATVQRFDRDGLPVGQPFHFTPGGHKTLGGQPTPETAVACGRDRTLEGSGWQPGNGFTCHLLDLDSGAVTPLPGAIRPLAFLTMLQTTDGTPPAPGALATRLFLDAEGALLLLDPETGTLHPAELPLGSAEH